MKEVIVIHQEIEKLLVAAREFPEAHPSTIDPAVRRAQYREGALSILGDMAPVASRRDLDLVLEGRTIAARLYTPNGDEEKALALYFHGGSFVVGDLDTHEGVHRRLCDDLKMKVLAVDYRLAPDHPFPAGLNDTVDSLHYVSSHLGEFGATDHELVVIGDSAGATLVAVASVLTKDEDLNIAAQVLIYPTMGPDVVTNSVHEFGHGYFLEMDHLQYDYQQYLGAFTDHTDPRVSPLFFTELSGVPPTVLVVAEYDPLRDEGLAYAGLLEHYGVPVEILEAQGMVHGFIRMGAIIPDTMDILDDLAVHVHKYVEHAAQ